MDECEEQGALEDHRCNAVIQDSCLTGIYVYFKEWVGMSGSFTGVTINTGRCTGITHEGRN